MFWLYSKHQFIQSRSEDKDELLLHQPSKITVSKQKIRIHNLNYDNYFTVAKWRIQTEYPIPKIMHAHLIREDENSALLAVYIQYWKCTLTNMKNLNFPTVLFILKQSLKAIEILVEKFGPFNLTSSMVGFTNADHCKLWMHENIEQCSKMSPLIQSKQSYNIMLIQLLQIIEKSCFKNFQSQIFFRQAQVNCSNCSKLEEYVNIFTYTNHLFIPPKILIIKNLSEHSQKSQNIQNSPLKQSEHTHSSGLKLLLGNQRLSRAYLHQQTPQIKPLAYSNMKSRVSFSYKNREKTNNIQKISNLKVSKETLAHSKDNFAKESCWMQPYLFKQQINKKKQSNSSSEGINSCKSSTKIQNITKIPEKNSSQFSSPRLKNYSVLNMKISPPIKIKSSSPKNLIDYVKNIVQSPESQSSSEKLRKLLKQNIKLNQWKKNISQLFNGQMNVGQSIMVKDESQQPHTVVTLQQLDMFGRYIASSVIEMDGP